MTRYLPSLKGCFPVVAVLLAYFSIPTFFPAGVNGGLSHPMLMTDWIAVALILCCCAFSCVFAVIRSRIADKIIAVLAGLVTLWIVGMCIRVALI